MADRSVRVGRRFNLGEYAVGSLSSDGYNIDVYANRQLEQALLDRIRPMERHH